MYGHRSVLLALALLAGPACAAHGQVPDNAPPGPFDGLLGALQLKGKASPAAPFVTQSRPKAEAPFVPVGAPHPERTQKVLTPAELAATETELDAARVRQQRRAGQAPAAVPLKPRGDKTPEKPVP